MKLDFMKIGLSSSSKGT